MATDFDPDEERADHPEHGDHPEYGEPAWDDGRLRDDGLLDDDRHAVSGVVGEPLDFGPTRGGYAVGFPSGTGEFAAYTEFVDPGDLGDQGAGEPAEFGWLGGPVGPAGLDDHNVLAGSDGSALDDYGDEASMVRPYALTRGRTRSNHDLKLETLVSTTEVGQEEAMLSQVEHRSISSLCRYPLSVAEVAAKLSIPLGVARVILSDMADLGLIAIHRTFADDDVAAHLVFMERVLSGLRRL